MTRPNITPGPWKDNGFINASERIVIESEAAQVAEVYCPSCYATRNANACAIAAVPALLEALEDLHRLASIQLHQSATMDGLVNCDAIAKARSALTAAGYQF